MRHDAHYVDELMSRTLDGSAHGAPAAHSAPAAALALIAGHLESVVTHANAVRSHPYTPALIAQSVHAELARVGRLARAAAILQERRPPLCRDLSARDIADGARIACAPVARMGGLECEVTVEDPAFMIRAESALVLQGIAGTVDAIVDLLLSDPRWPSVADGADSAPRILISLQSVRVRPALMLDIVCPALFIGNRDVERFFDDRVEDYRGAPAAGILLAAAAHVVRAHRGRADVKPHNGIGTTITYVYPQSVSEYSLT
jgi:hypothetical protein